jgi:hypothetical protein
MDFVEQMAAGQAPGDMLPEDALELRRKLINSLPGKYRLISSEEYLREKHGETARETQ